MTTKKITSLKKNLNMADGPAGLRLSKIYGIDLNGIENFIKKKKYKFS